ncbi:energy-coupling factor transporter ATP-binding protein EcfA2 [Streptacidiphilus sp. MAP12-20]|uniref:NACHT domain-containing protein n=1 Tax=Streptacidiphilus sp. MAP12-20 TaxID=3156299 RepID=UPI0035173BA9
MTHPQRERIAAVFGQGQGSGYLLSPWMVITAAHVVGEATAPTVAVPGFGGPVSCRVAWQRKDDRVDAAILVAETWIVPPTAFQAFERLPWGWFKDLRARPGVCAVGFPQVQRTADQRLDTEQVVGTLKPASGMVHGRPVLDTEHQPPTGSDGISPWAGMSGAPVFLDNCLVGLVRSVPPRWSDARLELTLGQEFVMDEEVCEVFEQGNVGFLRTWLNPPAESFEQRLREYLAREWGKVKIYGVTRSGRSEDSWQLDVAYLSLELSGGRLQLDDESAAVASRRVEDALAQQQRILLRGNAGSGKTTLLQWLTTLAARDELPDQLSQFKDCVPVLLRLRTLARPGQQLPGPEEFLRASGNPLAGFPGSEGWMSSRMAEGRVLLLVDGIDEAPESERRRVHGWLTGLLTAYPEIRCVVTTRPSAVREGWLSGLGFTELELLPMSRSDVAAFIERWHQAAAVEAGTERQARLAEWRTLLTEAVVRKQDLGRLATNPLMCSLICALNSDRQGHLPTGRMALYDAALEMLLVRRDEERGVDAASEGLTMSEAQQQVLLQKLAYWLIRNGQSELTAEQALARIEHALPQMPQIHADPARVLQHLLIRSGLLREPGPDAVDFVHRTFQDYLGALAVIEEGDLPLLIEHAHEDQWEDVFRLAVGHGRRRERTQLLTGILRRAEAEPQHAHRLRLLAATCLELAVELDPAVRHEVTGSAEALVPPRSVTAAKRLAAAGPVVLELLPGPVGLDDETARAVVVCATTIGTDRAIPLLASYAAHPYLEVRAQLAHAWQYFDTEQYGREVIARLDRSDELRLKATTRAEVSFLSTNLTGIERIEFSGDLPEEVIRLLPLAPLRELRLHENNLDLDLTLVQETPELQQLMLMNCHGRIDLAPLAGLPVERVILFGCADVPSLGPLGTMPRLQHLSFGHGVGNPFGIDLELATVLRAPALRSIRLTSSDLSQDDWELLRADVRIVQLDLDGLTAAELRRLTPLAHVIGLRLRSPRLAEVLADLPRVFPGLETLWLYDLTGDAVPPDVFPAGLLLGVDGTASPPGTVPAPRPDLSWSGQLTWHRVV